MFYVSLKWSCQWFCHTTVHQKYDGEFTSSRWFTIQCIVKKHHLLRTQLTYIALPFSNSGILSIPLQRNDEKIQRMIRPEFPNRKIRRKLITFTNSGLKQTFKKQYRHEWGVPWCVEKLTSDCFASLSQNHAPYATPIQKSLLSAARRENVARSCNVLSRVRF